MRIYQKVGGRIIKPNILYLDRLGSPTAAFWTALLNPSEVLKLSNGPRYEILWDSGSHAMQLREQLNVYVCHTHFLFSISAKGEVANDYLKRH